MAKGGKIQIVLDADVVIHFSKGGLLSLLPRIFPDYEYVLLEAVHEELLSDIRTQIDNQMTLLKNITLLPFAPRGEMLREYAMLRSRFGKGESACMAYCLFILRGEKDSVSHYDRLPLVCLAEGPADTS